MSSINDLKQDPVRVEIGGNGADSKQNHGSKTVITNNKANNRESVNISDISREPEEIPGVDVRESYVKDILEGENSLLGRYINEKTEEAKNWQESKEAERELEENNDEKDDSEEAIIGSGSIRDDIDDEREKTDEKIESEVVSVQFSVSSEDMELLSEDDNEDEEESNDNNDKVEKTEVVEEKVEEQPAESTKEDMVEAPDIDLEVSSVESEETLLLDEEDDDTDDNDDQNEILKHLQKMATERLKPASENINIKSFSIAKKPISSIKGIENTDIKAAKWVLPTQESIVLMKEFLGSELESLREYSEDNTSTSSLFRKFRSIYDHIVSKKPDTYEAWLKCTPYSDIDHYFFAAYISSFKGSNYLPLDCSKERNGGCGESFLSEDIPILDMVKFEDNKAKEKFTKLYQTEDQYTGKGIYVSEIIPFSSKIAIGFKDASIYNLLEIASLDQRTRDKYSNIIEFIPYIDAMYFIDQKSEQLIPIGYKIYPDNVNKTIRSKINVFSKVMSTLSIDEFAPIRAYINKIRSKSSGIKYILPSVNCPKCGKQTPETVTTAEELVFIRYQLGALVNTSLK